MAGAGYKLFTTGQVLTAAEVNTYLQEQTVMVFNDAASRTTALSGVLAEGMMSYLKSDDTVYVYNGTTWVSVANTGDITSVTAGTGLSGGGTTGDVTLSLSVPVTEVRGGTNQTTYTTGDVLYASGTNTLAKRAIGTTGQVLTVSGGVPTWATPASSTPTFVGAKCFNTTAQSIPNASWTTLAFDSESFDTDAFHSTSTNNSRITIPTGKAGKYLVQWVAEYAANATGSRNTRLLLNGVLVAYGIWSGNAGSGDGTIHNSTAILNLSVGDYLQIQIGQSSGGSLNAVGAETGCSFSVTYLGA